MTAKQIFADSWGGSFRAVGQNASLFIVAMVATAISNILFRSLAPPPVFIPDAAATNPLAAIHFTTAFLILSTVNLAINSIIFAPCMVAVHRYVLIGETGRVFENKERLIYFATILVGLRLIANLPSLFFNVIGSSAYLLMIGIAIISVRWVLTYPAIALDQGQAIEKSFGLTKGRWWYTVLMFLLIIFPLGITIAIVQGILMFDLNAGASLSPDARTVLSAAGESLPGIAYIALAAAAASVLFREYGGMTRNPRAGA